MSKMNNFFPNENLYDGESIENLYTVLRSMVEEAEVGLVDPLRQNLLLKDIDELHAYIMLELGMKRDALAMLAMNHPEVYDQAGELGNHISSLI